MSIDQRPVREFVRATLPWIVGPAIVMFVTFWLSQGPWQLTNGLLRSVEYFIGSLTSALIFATFAGGLRFATDRPTRRRVVTLMAIGLGYGLSAHVLDNYVAEYIAYYARSPEGRARRSPFGPDTPATMRRLRDYVIENGHTTTSPNANQPLGIPASWREFILQCYSVLVLMAVFSAVIGYLVGFLTNGLSPPVRRQTRWMLGIVNAFVYIAMWSGLSARLRGNLLAFNPYAHAWGTLSLHLAIIVILVPIVRDKFGD